MTTTIEKLGNPTSTRSGGRTLKHFWDLGPAPADALDGPGVVKAVLSVSHSKDRKLLVASLYQLAAYDSGTGFAVEKFSPMDPVTGFLTVARKPIARYSAKALIEFAAEALDILAYHVESGTEAVLARFTPTQEV